MVTIEPVSSFSHPLRSFKWFLCQRNEWIRLLPNIAAIASANR